MRSILIKSLVAAAVACTGQAASAQLPSSRSGSSSMTYLSDQEGMAALAVFGRCYAKEEPEKALRLLATEPSSRGEAQTYIALFKKSDEYCLGDVSSMSADLALVRGAIAEGLFKANVPLPPAMVLPAPAPAEVRNLAGAARCYAAAHREEVGKLIASTKPGSKAEYEAVSALMPDFFKCVPEGAKFSFGATVIRFRLAEALLRTAPPAAAAASAAAGAK
ncbi:MAG TPA: hypothetical protein VF655_07580 [Allosphingosinicella sp.]